MPAWLRQQGQIPSTVGAFEVAIRLLPDKLAQVYHLLVPENRRPVAVRAAALQSPELITEVRDEQASSESLDIPEPLIQVSARAARS
jgi:hypothetical protein